MCFGSRFPFLTLALFPSESWDPESDPRRFKRSMDPSFHWERGDELIEIPLLLEEFYQLSKPLLFSQPNQSDRPGLGVVFGHGRNEPRNKATDGLRRRLGRAV